MSQCSRPGSHINACRLLARFACYAFIGISLQQSSAAQTVPIDLPQHGGVRRTQVRQDWDICIHPVFRFAPADKLEIKPFEVVLKRGTQRDFYKLLAAGNTDAPSAVPHIVGEHLITEDGKVQFGDFGDVQVAGLSIEQTQQAIQALLAQFLENPRIEVEYKQPPTFYLILSGEGFEERVERRAINPSDTVLDVLVTLEQLPQLASAKMWIARPDVAGATCGTTLPIDFQGICGRAETETNHQIEPGDRLYIEGQSGQPERQEQPGIVSRFLTAISIHFP